MPNVNDRKVADYVICATCGCDVQQAGGKPVKMVSLPAEVRWQEAPNPQAALALVREARAQGVSQTETVLCRRCARLAGLVVDPVARAQR
jgi:hypothetical protein